MLTELFLPKPIRDVSPLPNQSCSSSCQSELFQLLQIRAIPTLANQSFSNSCKSELFQLLPFRVVPLNTNRSTSYQLELFHLLANQISCFVFFKSGSTSFIPMIAVYPYHNLSCSTHINAVPSPYIWNSFASRLLYNTCSTHTIRTCANICHFLLHHMPLSSVPHHTPILVLFNLGLVSIKYKNPY
jgi:hypothetical protein